MSEHKYGISYGTEEDSVTHTGYEWDTVADAVAHARECLTEAFDPLAGTLTEEEGSISTASIETTENEVAYIDSMGGLRVW